MSTIVNTCGFCEAADQTFDIVSHEVYQQYMVIVGARCRRCRQISCLTVDSPVGNIAAVREALGKNDDATSAINVRYRSPRLKEPEAPPHTPSEVSRAFVQAEKLSKSKEMAEPAAVMYGRTVELALEKAAHLKSITLTGNTLVKRIDDAASKHLLPADLAEWSHEVRQLRNDGAHVTDVKHEEVLELQGFVELLLRYLFTLPGVMSERRLKKANAAASAP